MSKCPNGIFGEKENCGNSQNCDPKKCMDMIVSTIIEKDWR
ncbi:MAG TPA: hypothetical protein VF893_01900 [Candidatus Bathyarchaeia archaeon]